VFRRWPQGSYGAILGAGSELHLSSPIYLQCQGVPSDAGSVAVTADIPLLGGPGDEQTVTVEVDEDGVPPSDLVAFVVEDDAPRVTGVYHLEPAAGGSGPPWLYVFVDR
jgi:hypothetical protein